MKTFLRNTYIVLLVIFSSHWDAFSQGSCASPDGTFFSASYLSGGISDYTTANGNGHCYNNLNAGQTYCWTYYYPSSGTFKINWIVNNACAGCGGGSSLISMTACSGGCSSFSASCITQYNSSCAVQYSGGIEHGGSGSCTPGQVCGTTFAVCIAVPAGCSTMDVCPLIYCTGSAGNCTALLPIELFSFTVKNECDRNTIQWTTATEKNNDFFTIERSLDGSTFEIIGTRKGGGNSSTPLKYEFVDDQLEISNQDHVYYRLKQTDFDGKFEYFNPISLQMNACENNISIYPTLTNGQVSIHSGKDQPASNISVFDALGRTVIAEKTSDDWTEKTVDLSKFDKGIYYVRVSSPRGEVVKKILLSGDNQ